MNQYIYIVSIHGNEVLINIEDIVSVEGGISVDYTFINLRNGSDIRTDLSVSGIFELIKKSKIQGGNNEQKVISETASTNTAAGFWVKDLKIQGGNK